MFLTRFIINKSQYSFLYKHKFPTNETWLKVEQMVRICYYYYMIHVTFNPNRKTLQWELTTYENVITIKAHDSFYEVFVSENDVKKPIFRFPINQTIIMYDYE